MQLARKTENSHKALGEVRLERQRQIDKWGDQHKPDGTGGEKAQLHAEYVKQAVDMAMNDGTITWRMVLDEEVSEAFAETDRDKLRAELIQVAAVAVAWIEDLDEHAS